MWFKNWIIKSSYVWLKPGDKTYVIRLIANNISKICGVSKEKVNIKAKTTEKLGVIGKEKAIAAEVIVSVIKYD